MPLAMLCPFFKKELGAKDNVPARLFCECVTMRFREKQMRREWVYKKCAGDYRSCQIYHLLQASYDRDEK
ncbi:MAG: hypothetical protein ACI3YH_03235 [Eubacteriales bacterium]